MTNNRGTSFSYEHVDPSRNSSDMGSIYWDFSLHELAKFDVVANIDYIKKLTQNKKISYLCHSQGCSQFLIGYTMNPEFFESQIDKFGTMGAVLNYSGIVSNN